MMSIDFSSDGGIHGAGDQVGKRSAYLHLAPPLLFKELVYLQLAYGLKAFPFGAYFTGVRVFDGANVHKHVAYQYFVIEC